MGDEIRFVHYRRYGGLLLTKHQAATQYTFDSPPDTKGGMTLCVNVTRNKVGVAWCSDQDVYDKKIGRTISEGRLNKLVSDQVYGDRKEAVAIVPRNIGFRCTLDEYYLRHLKGDYVTVATPGMIQR